MQKNESGSGWKWLAAAGALYFAYSFGYGEGQKAGPDLPLEDASYVAAVEAVDMPEDELLPPRSDAIAAAAAAADAAAAAAAAADAVADDKPSLAAYGSDTDDYYYIDAAGRLIPPPAAITNSNRAAAPPVSTAYVSAPSVSTARASQIAATNDDATFADVLSRYDQAPAPPVPTPRTASRFASPDTTATASRTFAPTPLPRVGCAENGSCYGDISPATGRPKTTHVQGYFRRDGTYVRGHFRSR